MRLSTLFKSTAIAGTLGLGVLLASASGASAHYTTTRCDSDGDRCWQVRCDDDGDDCRRVSSYDNNSYNRYGYGYGSQYGNGYSSQYGNSYSSRYGYGNGYGNSYRHRYGYWRCDADGDDCHWVRYRNSYNRDYDSGYNRSYNRDYDNDRYRY